MNNHVMKRVVSKLKREYNRCKISARLIWIRGRKLPIMTPEETVEHISSTGCSIARFGDGEFNIVFNGNGVNFQKGSSKLADRLREVLLSDEEDLLICLPHAINSVSGLNDHAREFYELWSLNNYRQLSNLLAEGNCSGHIFGDTNVTRPYKDWKSAEHAQELFPLMKKLWQERDVLFVEGEKTRLGIGNDLFDNTRSVKRILAPAVNAFDHYDEILRTVVSLHRGELVILALGPAATVLACDLERAGIRALDIGHIDIEYEWYLRGATSKTAIPGKYTNEAAGGDMVSVCEDPEYLSQIIAKVGI